jgi:hypothetical protein
MRHTGSCHCGAVGIVFETGGPLSPRACQCGFCRRHGARSVSDPDGKAILSFSEEPILYRFGAATADFILCRRCGAYVGATMGQEGEAFATLNLNAFDDPHPELDAVPVRYNGESAEARLARRRERWTPLVFERL